ncbi:MAG: hypothetical protein BGO55_14260 [Sphingobacteriales bacterium 50-39]|nr:hypothetical protein [Sphingobacteriales bacterium]OJW57452.1 MAG: hypothetical protein BGO55_14260 [Sphingobacteriales bacterium 50-39]
MKSKIKPTDNAAIHAKQLRRANRLNSIKNGLENSSIKEWPQIFAIMSETAVSIEMEISFYAFRNKINNPGEFTLNEVTRLAALFGVKYDVMADWLRDRIKAKSKSRIFRD